MGQLSDVKGRSERVGLPLLFSWKPLSWKLGAALLLAAGLWQTGSGLYIHAKALLAQVLIKAAWEETLAGKDRVRPWPWADTWPVARLALPELGADLYVLEGANGRSLAFGPGHIESTPAPGGTGHTVIGGHRDTHFSFLKNVKAGMEILVQNKLGRWKSYEVRETSIIDTSEARLLDLPGIDALTLVTCYPFDAIVPGGPLRYLVFAQRVIRPPCPACHLSFFSSTAPIRPL